MHATLFSDVCRHIVATPKLRVLFTDVVIRPITKACLLCPGSSSRHRQCQRTSPPMAQDAENRCYTFETLEIATAENRRKGNMEYNLPPLLATHKNLQHRRENQNTPLCRPSTPTEGRVCFDQQKLCTLKTGATGSCVNTRMSKGLSVHVRCRVTDTITTLPHAFTRCIFKWTLHHIGHVTRWYITERGSVRDN